MPAGDLDQRPDLPLIAAGAVPGGRHAEVALHPLLQVGRGDPHPRPARGDLGTLCVGDDGADGPLIGGAEVDYAGGREAFGATPVYPA